jgi:hypothetical protein
MWEAISGDANTSPFLGWVQSEGFERRFLIVNAMLTILFGLYQLAYWNFIWKDYSEPRPTDKLKMSQATTGNPS